MRIQEKVQVLVFQQNAVETFGVFGFDTYFLREIENRIANK